MYWDFFGKNFGHIFKVNIITSPTSNFKCKLSKKMALQKRPSLEYQNITQFKLEKQKLTD